MSRFQNLEFEDEQQPRQEVQQRTSRDETSWLEEAAREFHSGRFERALRCYGRALEYNPASRAAWAGQVRMLIELGEAQEAKLWSDKGLEVCPNDAELLAASSVALGRLGDLAAAITFSDAAVEAGGQSSYVWLARADVLLARQERAADYCMEKAIGLSSVQWLISWLASRVYSVHRQFAKALRMAQQALDSGADRAVVWVQLAACRYALGMASAGRVAVEQARQLDPDSVTNEQLLEWTRGSSGGWVRGWWRRLRGR
jgi:tetratricopeptide (TPR) repeat protein